MLILRPDSDGKVPRWKTAALIIGVVVIGAAAIIWNVYKVKVNERKLAETVGVYRAGAEKGDASAEFSLGSIYYYGKGLPQDYAEALRWYHKSAEQGNAKAQYKIGCLYYYGQGVTTDYAQALRWYSEAANQGDPKAEYGLGYIYSLGQGVTKDNAEAARWFRKSSDHGYAKAQVNLGEMYSYGQGVPRDKAEADRWFHRAADQGDENAQRILGVRLPPLKTWTRITHTVIAVGSLLLLISLLFPKKGTHNRQSRATAATGFLGLLYIALYLFEHSHYCVFPFAWSANAFDFATHILAGLTLPLLFFIVLPKSPKIVLTLSVIYFVGLNLLFAGLYVYVFSRHRSAYSPFLFSACYRFEGFPIGMFISSAFLLRRVKRNAEGTVSGGSKLDVTEDPVEEESESDPENSLG